MKESSKMTLEQRKKISESMKGKIPKNMELLHKKAIKFKKGQTPWNKGKTGMYSIETKMKMQKGRERTWANPELRMKQSELTKQGMANPLVREKISKAKKGKPSWNKGKKLFYKVWIKGKHHTEEDKIKMSKIVGERISNPKYLRKLSEIHKKRLSNPEEMKRQGRVSRANLLRLYESGAFPKQENTKPEREIKAELIKRGYKEGTDFIHQYKFMNKFMCDFCFPKQEVIVEAYGDFWHVNPKKYPIGIPLHPHQIKGIGRDKSKEAYITTVDNRSWTYLILWESDIKKDVAKCVDRIEETLAKSKGMPQT
ncbi:hypothetical protein HYT92_02180 [Candidatus Pacearchaeota archaeon]|nr:hypothetical protein [Candidatus Pacearchaeota archaeon]